MPNFDAHLQRGTQWASVVAVLTLLPVYLYTGSILAVAVFAGVTFCIGLLGAVLPDIDSHSSIPRRYLERTFSTILVSSVFFTLGFYWSEIRSRLEGLTRFAPRPLSPLEVSLVGGLIVTAILLRFVPDLIHRLLPHHRGLLHTLTFGVTASLGLTVVSVVALEWVTRDALLATFAGVTFGGALLGGITVHLQMDGELPGSPFGPLR